MSLLGLIRNFFALKEEFMVVFIQKCITTYNPNNFIIDFEHTLDLDFNIINFGFIVIIW